MKPTTRTQAKIEPRQDASELIQLSEEMLRLQARLEFLDELTERIHGWAHWTDEIGMSWDALLESVRDEALEKMYLISTQAAGLRCRSHLELYAKSRIWRMRRIPEHADDVTILAESMALDIGDLIRR